MIYSNIIGLDPGTTGAISVLNPDGTSLLFAMPLTVVEIVNLIVPYIQEKTVAYLEDVHAFPGQGVSSSFTFGRNLGKLEGVLGALKIRTEYVAPQKWQKALGSLTKGDKKVSVIKATELYPNVKGINKLTADALLIAEYGRRVELGLIANLKS